MRSPSLSLAVSGPPLSLRGSPFPSVPVVIAVLSILAVLTVSLVLAVLAVPVLMPGRVVAASVAGALICLLLRLRALNLSLLRLLAPAPLPLLASALPLAALRTLSGPALNLCALDKRLLAFAALLSCLPAVPLPVFGILPLGLLRPVHQLLLLPLPLFLI